MSDSNITKQALANALKEVIAEKSFDKIVVNDIVQRCNLNRLTFYYHFKDKYDLMNWIYYTETARFMSQYNSIDNWTEGLCALCYYMQANKSFYTHALNTSGQNSFPDYLLQYVRDITLARIEERKGKKKTDPKYWEFVAEFCSIAFVGLIVKWAQNGMKEDPREYIQEIVTIIDGSMLHELIESK